MENCLSKNRNFFLILKLRLPATIYDNKNPLERMIRITHNGTVIECSNSAEAIEVLKYLASEENKKIQHQHPGLAALAPSNVLTNLFGGGTITSAWTRESFWKFLENLGDSQQQVLKLLVRNRKATDEEIR